MNHPHPAATATISRADFDRLQSVAARRLLPSLLAPYALFVFATPFKIWQREWSAFLGIRYPSVEADIAMVLPACVLGLFMIPWLLWRVRRLDARDKIPCPTCGGALHPVPYVTATGCCPLCKTPVLNAPDPLPAEQIRYLPFTAPQFQAAVPPYRRRVYAAQWITMGTAVACWILSLFILPVNSPLQVAPLLVCGIWAIVWIVKVERRQSFACPSCSHRLDSHFQIVAETGHCTKCGHAVFAEESGRKRTGECSEVREK